MSIWRRIRGIGWLIALVTTAAAIITRTVVSLRGRQPETVVDAIPAPPVASELAPPRPVEEIEIHLPAPSIWPEWHAAQVCAKPRTSICRPSAAGSWHWAHEVGPGAGARTSEKCFWKCAT